MEYKARENSINHIGKLSQFPCSLLLELFPFGILINQNMNIMGAGEKLVEVWKTRNSFLNEPVGKYFKLRRPKGIAFSWKNVFNFSQDWLFSYSLIFLICRLLIWKQWCLNWSAIEDRTIIPSRKNRKRRQKGPLRLCLAQNTFY